jgi:hypothetical protein
MKLRGNARRAAEFLMFPVHTPLHCGLGDDFGFAIGTGHACPIDLERLGFFGLGLGLVRETLFPPGIEHGVGDVGENSGTARADAIF